MEYSRIGPWASNSRIGPWAFAWVWAYMRGNTVRDEDMSIVLMNRNRFGKMIMPHHSVNGTLFIAVKYRYDVREIYHLFYDF